jgi:hypothetical protein
MNDMDILEKISRKLSILDNKNEARMENIIHNDFYLTFDEGYCEGVNDVISEIRAIMRKEGE